MDQCNERLHFCFLLIGSKFHIRAFGLLSILRWFFYHNERRWSSSSLLHVDVHFPSPICWGICPLQNGCFRCLCCKSVGYKSLGSYFCNLCDYVGLCVCCLPIPCCLGYTPLQCLQGIMVLWGFFSSLLWYVVFYNVTQMSWFFSSSLKTVIHILEWIKIWACRF